MIPSSVDNRPIVVTHPDNEIQLARKLRPDDAASGSGSRTGSRLTTDTIASATRNRAHSILSAIEHDVHPHADFGAVAERTNRLIDSGLSADAEAGRAGSRDALARDVFDALKAKQKSARSRAWTETHDAIGSGAAGAVTATFSGLSLFGVQDGVRNLITTGIPTAHTDGNLLPALTRGFEALGGSGGVGIAAPMAYMSARASYTLAQQARANFALATSYAKLLDKLPTPVPRSASEIAMQPLPQAGPVRLAPPLQHSYLAQSPQTDTHSA